MRKGRAALNSDRPFRSPIHGNYEDTNRAKHFPRHRCRRRARRAIFLSTSRQSLISSTTHRTAGITLD